MKKIRLLIIDEHPAVCQALTVRLQSVPSVEVVGATSTFSEGMAEMCQLQPDIVLMELKGKGESGTESIDAISGLLSQGPIGVIVLTSYLDEAEREEALHAGASRYLLKDIDTLRLIVEIEAVANEGVPLLPPQSGHAISKTV